MNQPTTSNGNAVAANRPWMLTLSLLDKASVTEHYMPFIKGGAIFVETEKQYQLQDSVFVLLTLGEEQKKFPINGKVVWISPKEARGDRSCGIGVQFPKDETGDNARATIEEMTGKMFWSIPKTATL